MVSKGVMRAVIALALLVSAAGCLLPSSPVMSAQQAAQEMNLNARFGRRELVMDSVAPAARDAFAAHHSAWGSAVRIADVGLAGSRAKGDNDVDIFVRVSWYREQDQELRSTLLKQGWHEKAGSWQLVSEARSDGDMGLLGEPVVYEKPPVARAPAQFPTVVLGGGGGRR
ncbi:MAG: hypothetical protein ACREJ3_09870 [Polyangiaceae bacterium]